MAEASGRAGAAERPDRPYYGPSLPELLRPPLRRLGRRQRLALVLAAVAVIAAVAAVLVRREASVATYEQSASDASARGLPPIPFNFDHSRKLDVSKPRGAYVRVEHRISGTLAARFTVSPLRIGRQPGLISGFMPIVATRYERAAKRRYENFRLVFEGRARVNEVEGYQFAFTARLVRSGKPPRLLFGRVVMLAEPYDAGDPEKEYPAGTNPQRGLMITMLATTLDKVPSATRLGDEGVLQRPFRSFRFSEAA
jgi:hypothetical protein